MLRLRFNLLTTLFEVQTPSQIIFDMVLRWYAHDRVDDDPTVSPDQVFLIHDAAAAEQIDDPELLDFHRRKDKEVDSFQSTYRHAVGSKGILYGDSFATWSLRGGVCTCLFHLDRWVAQNLNYHAFYYFVFRTMFYEGLWQQSIFWMHAAAVRHRELGPILIVGNSNQGKSTLSLAFCELGHQLLSDDSVYFRSGDAAEVEFASLKREFQLDRTLGRRLKSLRSIENRATFGERSHKVPVRLEEFYPHAAVQRLHGVRAVVFTRLDGEPSEIQPLTPQETLWRLVCHSYTGMWDPNAAVTSAFLRTQQSIARSAASMCLLNGPDNYADPLLGVRLVEAYLRDSAPAPSESMNLFAPA